MQNKNVKYRARRTWTIAIVGTLLGAVLYPVSAMITHQKSAPPLDLSTFNMTFNETFQKLDVSSWGPNSSWIAHTPWHGDFGDDKFDDPGKDGPFKVTPQGLTITAFKDKDGHWHAGLLCSLVPSPTGPHGFSQRDGYFEIKAKLPDGPGVGPAFWLVGERK